MAAPDNTWRKAQEARVTEALAKGLRHVLLVDTETTGLDPSEAQCIEVGCVRFDLRCAQPVESFASLIRCDRNDAEEHNNIPVEMLKSARCGDRVWRYVKKLVMRSDLIVSHRVEFDHAFFPEDIRSIRPWCCSKFDIEWPKGKNGGDLLHLSLANGIGVVHAHRAMSDCDVLSRLFTRTIEAGYDIQQMLRRALRPKMKVISLAHFNDKDVVKSHGFAWDADAKQWYKWVAIDDVHERSFPFKIKIAG